MSYAKWRPFCLGLNVLNKQWSRQVGCEVSNPSTQIFFVIGRFILWLRYRKTSNISRTLVSNKIVDNSDVVGASPAGAAPTTSSFST